jgi:hypothetical protein
MPRDLPPAKPIRLSAPESPEPPPNSDQPERTDALLELVRQQLALLQEQAEHEWFQRLQPLAPVDRPRQHPRRDLRSHTPGQPAIPGLIIDHSGKTPATLHRKPAATARGKSDETRLPTPGGVRRPTRPLPVRPYSRAATVIVESPPRPPAAPRPPPTPRPRPSRIPLPTPARKAILTSPTRKPRRA